MRTVLVRIDDSSLLVDVFSKPCNQIAELPVLILLVIEIKLLTDCHIDMACTSGGRYVLLFNQTLDNAGSSQSQWSAFQER